MLLLALSVGGMAVERGEEIRLWKGGAPGFESETAAEVSTPGADSKLPSRFTLVHYPSVYVFLPEAGKANGSAVVIAPGGGHTQLVIDKEGWDIAAWCNKLGMAAFVLKYRLGRLKDSKYSIEKHSLEDATRAMRLVRSRAKEWNIDPARVGFMGFSAGAETAGFIEAKFDAGDPSAADPIERFSSRPDFNVLVYPGRLANHYPVVKQSPPAFLICADNDRSHIMPTVQMYVDLQKLEVPAELHVYTSGGHGFGMKQSALPVATWPDRLRDWFIDRKILPQ